MSPIGDQAVRVTHAKHAEQAGVLRNPCTESLPVCRGSSGCVTGCARSSTTQALLRHDINTSRLIDGGSPVAEASTHANKDIRVAHHSKVARVADFKLMLSCPTVLNYGRFHLIDRSKLQYYYHFLNCNNYFMQ